MEKPRGVKAKSNNTTTTHKKRTIDSESNTRTIIIGFFLFIAVALCIFIGYTIKKDNAEKKKDLDALLNDIEGTPQAQSIERESTLAIDEANAIIEGAKAGAIDFSYNIYAEINATWKEQYTDDKLKQLELMGGTKDSLNGVGILAVAGKVTPDLEMMSVMKQRTMINALESSSQQIYFDFATMQSYTKEQKLGYNNQIDDSGWVTNNFVSNHISIEHYLMSVTAENVTEDDKVYYIKGMYKPNSNNDISWVLTYIEQIYGVSIVEDIPITMIFNKRTKELEGIEYDLSQLNDKTIFNFYKVTDTILRITFSDMNKTTIEVPEDLRDVIRR